MPDQPHLATIKDFLRFGAIGFLATVIHIGIAVALVEDSMTTPVAANAIAFFPANAFAYFANSRFNFRRPLTHWRYMSFLAISLLNFPLTVSVAALAEFLGWHYLAGLALVVLVTPTLSFLLQRKFTFR